MTPSHAQPTIDPTDLADLTGDVRLVEPERLSRRDDPDQIAHLVCCRDVSWRRAFCGEDTDGVVNLEASTVCSLCVEVVLRLDPEVLTRDPRRCPVDENPCPAEPIEDVIDERMSNGPFG